MKFDPERGHASIRYSADVLIAGLAACAFLMISVLSPRAQNAGQSQGHWAEILAAAKKEGKVVAYFSAAAPITQRLVDGFKAAHPDIPIEAVHYNSGELLSKVDTERNTGVDGADVVQSTDENWFLARAKEGKLLHPDGPAAAGWPSAYLTDGAIIASGLNIIALPYSTVQVNPPPTGFADLLKPEFKGRIGISELASSTLLAFYDWLERTQGSDYLTKLKAQNPKLYTAGPAIAQAIASGEIAIGNVGIMNSITPLIKAGAPVNYMVPSPSFGFAEYLGGVSWSKRPNATLVLLDYLMSRTGQEVWHGEKDSASPLKNIPGSLDGSNVTLWNAADYPPEIIKSHTEHWNSIFKH